MSTSIEWLQSADGSWNPETWNPVVGCEPAGVGCLNCYAKNIAHRGMCEQHRGLTQLTKDGIQWTGEVRLVPDQLDKPLRWRKPRMVMCPSMGDLFHRDVPFEFVAAVFGVMAACPQHFFVIPTKRTARMREGLAWMDKGSPEKTVLEAMYYARQAGCLHEGVERRWKGLWRRNWSRHWPLPNIALLASVSTQADADRLLPDLMRCPAAVLGVSYEPAISEIDWRPWVFDRDGAISEALRGPALLNYEQAEASVGRPLDWLIVGGESGPSARPCDVAWIRSTVEQCRDAGVPCFVKAVGANPVDSEAPRPLTHDQRRALVGASRKGGDPSRWPASLRIRELPR